MTATTRADSTGDRSVLFLASPCLWPDWPFLPLVRRRPGHDLELGVVIDLWRAAGIPGYSSAVFKVNRFEIPRTIADILKLDKCVYDSAEELVADHWRVD